MTCIVGVVDKDRVLIGGDSAGVADWKSTVRSDAKVFRVGDFVLGFTTSFRMGQVLRYAFTPPVRHSDTDLMAYMVTDFVDAVRDSLKAAGYAKKENDVESGGTFLVGYGRRLFCVESDYQVSETMHGIQAIGCGGEFALGAMHAARCGPAIQVANAGLLAAAEFSAGVRPPFHFEYTDPAENSDMLPMRPRSTG